MICKVGIIGCGKIAQTRHIPEYLRNKRSLITGVYDINFERATAVASEIGCVAYKNVEEMLESAEIDAVSVCSINKFHAQHTIQALEHGKHVLCEKPMGCTLQECEDMISAEKKAGKRLMIGHNQRLAEAHVLAKKMIADGRIGDVLHFRTTFGHGGPETWSVDSGNGSWFFDKNRSAMGVIADLGIHKIDLIQYLTGQNIVNANAMLATLDKRFSDGKLIDVEDNAIIICGLSGGAIGTIHMSWTFYGLEDNSTVLYGSKGIMKIFENKDSPLTVIDKDGKAEYFNVEDIQTNDKQTNTGIIDEFINSILDNRMSRIECTDILPAMKVVFSCIESSNQLHA